MDPEQFVHKAADSGWLFSNVLNLYDSFLLMIAVLAVLLTIPLLLKRDRQLSDLLLAAFILSQGTAAFFVPAMYNKFIGPEYVSLFAPYHFIPTLILIASQGFLLHAYVKTMTGERCKLLDRENIAGMLLVVLAVTTDLVMRSEAALQFKTFSPFSTLLLSVSVYMGILSLIKLLRFDRKIREFFSNIDRIRLRWLLGYAAGFVVVWAITLFSYLIGLSGFKEVSIALGTFANLPPLLLMSGLVVHGQVIPLNFPHNATTDKGTQEKALPSLSEHKRQLEDLMNRVKIYQDPELRLDGLADSLKLSPRTVSTLLNQHYNQSFYDFINHYRVMDAQRQLRATENVNKSVQRIFEDAGFNSKTTFNTLFKRTTGKTPSEYRKTLESNGDRHSQTEQLS